MSSTSRFKTDVRRRCPPPAPGPGRCLTIVRQQVLDDTDFGGRANRGYERAGASKPLGPPPARIAPFLSRSRIGSASCCRYSVRQQPRGRRHACRERTGESEAAVHNSGTCRPDSSSGPQSPTRGRQRRRATPVTGTQTPEWSGTSMRPRRPNIHGFRSFV